jgi:hypothetical protein
MALKIKVSKRLADLQGQWEEQQRAKQPEEHSNK